MFMKCAAFHDKPATYKIDIHEYRKQDRERRVESIAIRGEQRQPGVDIGYRRGWICRQPSDGPLGLNFIELGNPGTSIFFMYCTLPLFYCRYILEHIFALPMVAAVGMHFTRVMLGHAEEHPSCSYVCRLDEGGGARIGAPVRRIDVCVRRG